MKPYNTKFLTILLSVTLINFITYAKKPTNTLGEIYKQTIQKKTLELLKDPVFRSLSIGIYKDGKTYTGYFGELEKGKKANDKTFFEVASVTKSFTGTLVAQAVLDGEFSVEDDIRKYLEKDYPNLAFKGKPIKIRHLITHTSGFPANHKDFEAVPFNNDDGLLWNRLHLAEKNYTKTKFFQDLKKIVIEQEPGTQFLYSNLGTNMVAHILERVYKKTYQKLLQEFIFNKAGMHNTKLNLSSMEEKLLAGGFNEKGVRMPALPLGKTLWGAEGALKATLPDIIKYMAFQLDEENNHAVKESHKRLHKLADGYWIGYFWWVINYQNGINNKDGIKTYRHDGGAKGTRNIMLLYPKYNLGISIITNVVEPTVFDKLSKLGFLLFDDLKNININIPNKPIHKDDKKNF